MPVEVTLRTALNNFVRVRCEFFAQFRRLVRTKFRPSSTDAGPYGGGVRWVRTNPPPVPTYGKQKLEPNHFVAVPDLFERSELEVSLTLVSRSQTAFTRKAVWLRETNLNILKLRTVLHFVMTSLDDYDLAATMKRQQASN